MYILEFKVSMKSFLLLIACFVYVTGSYFNAECPYELYGAKTPYDAVRGDIRDYPNLDGCEAISVWTLIRHGNRNPGTVLIKDMKEVAALKDEIIASYEAGMSLLSAQVIDQFRTWSWNSTLDINRSALNSAGYKELYGIGKRIRQKYTNLLQGTADQFYLRSTKVRRTIESCSAFLDGLTDGIHLNVTVEDPWDRDDLIWIYNEHSQNVHYIGSTWNQFERDGRYNCHAYVNCERYRKDVLFGRDLDVQTSTYFTSPEFVAVQKAVQVRLGIVTQLSANNVHTIYESCRRYRTWAENPETPWCAVFTNEDLKVLEYDDDIIHYYRNGPSSWLSIYLGRLPLKDLYDNFEAVLAGEGKKLVGYFVHNSMSGMMYSALGLNVEKVHLESTLRNPDRVWRSSYTGPFATNLLAVLNRCNEAGNQTHRIQIFINEKETTICPLEGCSWEEFQDKFQMYTTANLSFCSMDYEYKPEEHVLNRGRFPKKPEYSKRMFGRRC